MSRAVTRKAAAEAAAKPGSGLALEPSAAGTGIREWLDSLGTLSIDAAAFDTRVRAPAAFTGRASRGASKVLRRHGLREAAEPESFFVAKDNRLEPGEEDRARAWGERLAARHGPAA